MVYGYYVLKGRPHIDRTVMSHNCSFNTGVEIPTAGPVDITVFGGAGARNGTTGCYMWQWDARRDSERCLATIRDLEATWGLPHVSFASFSTGQQGSAEIWQWLQAHRAGVPAHAFEAWLVGCIIYHQLLWTPHLMGEW